jgi:nucleotide-binding universal stress UspA family protein
MRYAFFYARREKLDRIDFLHVVTEPFMTGATLLLGQEERRTAQERLRHLFLQEIRAAQVDSEGLGVPFEFFIELGSPSAVIVHRAEEEEYEMVLIGHRGMSDLERFLIGSVAARVVRHAPCSVLVFHPREEMNGS